jgi:protease-4
MKKGTYVLILFLVFFFLMLVAFASILYIQFGRPPTVKSNSYLEIVLSGELQEKSTPSFLARMFTGTEPLSLHDIRMSIKKAKVDSRIRGILLRIGYLECGWAKMSELRGLILDFRKSGKKVFAYIKEVPEFDKEYYLATGCDKIILHPSGIMVVNGIGGYFPFIKGALDKLGVEIEAEKVEEFKTAPNIFTEKRFTPSHKEMMESLYESLYSHYVETVAEARKKTEEEIKMLLDHGIFQGEKAKDAGLVDELLHDDEVEELFQENGRRINKIWHSQYAKIKPTSLGLNKGKKIALIYGMGTIHTGESLSQTMGSATVSRWIKKARKDSSIKAIVFRVDSPGGTPVSSDIIWRELSLAKKEKPVIVSMSDLAGSGGYIVSLPAHKIVAQPQTLTGSIGVYLIKLNLSSLYEKLGITGDKLAIGKRADMFSTFRKYTSEERELIKKELLWSYDQFVAKVAESRSMTKEEVDRIGRGRVWTGNQAQELGLVDEIGGLTKAIELAKELAGILPEEQVKLIVQPKKISFVDYLFGKFQARADLDFHPNLERALRTLKLLHKEKIWALMPLWQSPE